MAGHSHSANIRFRKDRVDAKRARLFAKLARMLTVAARQGGGSVEGNARLRLAVDKARVVSMPRDVIERAIRKGTGEGATGDFEDILYEGYGPGGVAVLLEILTDNRHRTAAEVRRLFETHGGNLATSGSVAWMFERRGVFHVDPAAGRDENRLLEIALESGAEDLARDGDAFAIYCAPAAFSEVKAGLDRGGLRLRAAEIGYVPTQRCPVHDPAVARRVASLLDALDDHDDVQGVHSNEDFSDDIAKAMAEAP